VRYAAPLVWGRLERRYKRFLADVVLDSGERVLAHVPNSGAMRGCSENGSRCLLLRATNPCRALAWTLEQVIASGIPVGVNTARANALVEEALRGRVALIPGLVEPWTLRREVMISQHSRTDFCLTDPRGATWVEVKSVSWAVDGVALFPDAVTSRGARHLAELAERVRGGERAVLLYVVQRGDASGVGVSPIDSVYTAALVAARRASVTVIALQVAVAPGGLIPWRCLPVHG